MLFRSRVPLKLAADGGTDYAIVIAVDAREAEAYAAKELAYFLKKMTGAEFPVRRDATPPGERELVGGERSVERRGGREFRFLWSPHSFYLKSNKLLYGTDLRSR